MIIPNPTPICYKSIEEYTKLRMKRKDFSKPYFVLLAGGKGKGNEEAVKATIGVFNKLPPNTFKLYITGPWQDLQKQVKNTEIGICGIVPEYKLKELLAIADYGLAPVFSHIAGSFLKVLAYVAAGLHVVTSPWGLQGINIGQLRGRQVFIVRNLNEYKETILKIISNPKIIHPNSLPSITVCRDASNINGLLELLKVL
ncbi:glycosyltransferase [Desulfurococcus amylolyticus]|nr:glycosyltransferase [Desulfurococcus amylolyticus]